MSAVGLGPVAVDIRRRRRGIAHTLIEAGIAELDAIGVQAVFVLGDLHYYARLGLVAVAALRFSSPYAGPYFMVRALTPEARAARTATVAYALAFGALKA